MDDIKLAMLGNREAAKRLTDAGKAIPCPMCGADPYIEDNIYLFQLKLICPHGCACGNPAKSRKDALLSWNTRAPILSESEMEMLEGME